MEAELSEAKRETVDALRELTTSKDTVKNLRISLDSSTALISRLEAELEQQTQSQGKRGHVEHGKDAASKAEAKTAAADRGVRELSELLGVTEVGRAGEGKKGPEGGVGGVTGEGSQMVAILQGQRDRYKERMTKAETALYPLQQQLEAATAAKTQLEADNVALYGKIQYLKSVGEGGSR